MKQKDSRVSQRVDRQLFDAALRLLPHQNQVVVIRKVLSHALAQQDEAVALEAIAILDQLHGHGAGRSKTREKLSTLFMEVYPRGSIRVSDSDGDTYPDYKAALLEAREAMLTVIAKQWTAEETKTSEAAFTFLRRAFWNPDGPVKASFLAEETEMVRRVVRNRMKWEIDFPRASLSLWMRSLLSEDGNRLKNPADFEIFGLMGMARTRNGGRDGMMQDLKNELFAAQQAKSSKT